MPQTITKGVKALVKEANAIVKVMSIAEAKTRLDDDEYVFVDIRDIREIKRGGTLPGAFLCPRGMLEFWIDPDSTYHKSVFNQDKTYVFYCAGALRSALAAKVAMEMGLAPVQHLEGGFAGWVKQDGPVDKRED